MNALLLAAAANRQPHGDGAAVFCRDLAERRWRRRRSGWRRGLAVVVLLTAACPGRADEEKLAELVGAAWRWHPAVKAARHELEALAAAQRGVDGFFDPQLYASAGSARRHRGIPGATNAFSLTDDATTLQTGVERAILPGLYAGVGASAERLRHPGDGPAYRYRFGPQVRVPLWRDRGFRNYRFAADRARADYMAGWNRLLATGAALQRDVETIYIAMQEAFGNWQATRRATARVLAVQAEAKELVRLQVVAEHQVLATALELALRQEAELAAAEEFDRACVQLAQLTGTDRGRRDWTLPTEEFIAWAGACAIDADPPIAVVVERRGGYQELVARQEANEAEVASARDAHAPDVSLKLAATWAGSARHTPLSSNAERADEEVGASVQLVWTHPLGRTESRERINRSQARAEALAERLRRERLRIETALATAGIAFRSNRKRLGLATKAGAAARQTLVAEQERFRLGEGRSRQVLDAEQDLTQAVRLQVLIAARLLRARAEYRHAVGATAEDVRQNMIVGKASD